MRPSDAGVLLGDDKVKVPRCDIEKPLLGFAFGDRHLDSRVGVRKQRECLGNECMRCGLEDRDADHPGNLIEGTFDIGLGLFETSK